ncbi:EAL domain-containing protein [Magnetospirillum fulvum MGU-K5]|uniref:EAL domain-containing protein n=1 Tax=Magnetospirillum fulvum MGU-K5 TaxID=1316936 RepID=S9S7E8_MAGFU|nr:EAL domain-containing protein [Magnetospirillum fulvum MGU-K5]
MAEGVERVEELAVLKEAGLRFVQGFLFARPTLEAMIPDSDIDFG